MIMKIEIGVSKRELLYFTGVDWEPMKMTRLGAILQRHIDGWYPLDD